MNNEYISRIPITQAVSYAAKVPFNKAITICETTLTANDELTPIAGPGYAPEFYPVAGSGALYRLISDGVHTPTFNALFKKSTGSGDWVLTAGKLNLITFLFDGVDFWYSICQAQ